MPDVRKSHQRALESLQASLDVEVKGRAEGLKLKKKLEADVNELELQVDLLTKSNAELSKNSKKMQQQIKVCSGRAAGTLGVSFTSLMTHQCLSQELQAQLEEEVRSHEESREEQAAVERRCSLLVSEGEEARAALESAERARKALEMELQDAAEKYSDLNNQVSQCLCFSFTYADMTRSHSDFPDSVPGGSDREEEAGGGSPDSPAGARGAAGRDQRMHRQS